MAKGEATKKIGKIVAMYITVASIIIVLAHFYFAGYRFMPPYQQRAFFLCCVLVLVFLIYPFRKKDEGKTNWTLALNLFLSIAGVASCIYFVINYEALFFRMGRLNTIDIMVAVTLLVVVLEGCRRVIGWPLVGLVLGFIAYAFWGDLLPRAVAHTGHTFQRTIQQVSLTLDGLFGQAIGATATTISIFLVFGALLQASGAGQVFINLSLALFGRVRGGPGKTAMGASAMFALVSPSQVANVATTGVFTIPLMIKAGYSRLFAGGILAAASCGGFLTPPLLGAAAFLIADFLSVPYSQVVIATIVPAFLFYVSMFLEADLNSARLNLPTIPKEDVPEFKKTFKDGAHLLLPLVVLCVCLFVLNLSTGRSAFFGAISVPFISWLHPKTRMTWKKFVMGCQSAAKMMVLIGISTGTAGFVLGVIYQTGLGLRFSAWMVALSGGDLFLLLIMTMFASIILGLGLPPIASYLLLAILGGPALIRMGVNPMAAHMFIFFFGCLSEITPPSCNAAFTAGAIAGAPPMRTGWEACRVALAAFVIPFMFVYSNELILVGTAVNILISVATALIAVIALACALEGYLMFSRSMISWPERVVLFAITALCAIPNFILTLIGVGLFAALLIFRRINRKDPPPRKEVVAVSAEA